MDAYFIFFGIFVLLWLYSFFSTLTSEFKNNTNKIVWILLLIFLPISALIYPFIGKQQTIEGTGISGSKFLGLIVGISIFLILIYANLKVIHFLYSIFGINPKDYFYGYGDFVGSFFSGILLVGFLWFFNLFMEISLRKKIFTIFGLVVLIVSFIVFINIKKEEREHKQLIEKINNERKQLIEKISNKHKQLIEKANEA